MKTWTDWEQGKPFTHSMFIHEGQNGMVWFIEQYGSAVHNRIQSIPLHWHVICNG